MGRIYIQQPFASHLEYVAQLRRVAEKHRGKEQALRAQKRIQREPMVAPKQKRRRVARDSRSLMERINAGLS